MKTEKEPPTGATDGKQMTDVRGIAQMLMCSPRHVARLRDLGRLPAPVKLGSLVRWNRRQIEEWIAAGCPATRKT